MKILHIITGLNNGGAEATLFRLALSDRENSHYVISLMDKGIYGDQLMDAGIPVYALNMSRGKVSIGGLRKLYGHVKAINPDVVQTWMYHADLIGGTASRIAGVKSIIWGLHGGYDKTRTSLSTKMVIRTCSLLSKVIPRKIVSSSKHAANTHRLDGYAADKLVIIPNGYLLDQFRNNSDARGSINRRFEIASNVILIGMVARFDPYKDHENLFSALSRLNNLRKEFVCLLVGPGMEAENHSLISLIHKYKIEDKIKLLGARRDIPEIMEALDLHILSSASESFPNVIAEAMIGGTPCISTNVGDVHLIVGDTGWLVPHSNPAALSNAIQDAIHAMDDVSGWASRKEACRRRIAENYGIDRMVASYKSVWDGIYRNGN